MSWEWFYFASIILFKEAYFILHQMVYLMEKFPLFGLPVIFITLLNLLTLFKPFATLNKK